MRSILSASPLLFLLFSTHVVSADEAAEQLVLATYKLANEASTASGTVVCFKAGEEEHCAVLTAQHVFSKMRGDSCLLVSRVAREDGMFGRKEIQIAIRRGGRQLWLNHPKLDLALLPLPKHVQVESLPSDCIAKPDAMEGVHVGDAVRLSVFPERAESNDAGFPILRGGSIASFPLVPVKPHPIFMIDTTSWTGDSGGPVMHSTSRSPSGGPMVIGIVRGMRSVTDTTRESRFVERRSRYPLGISEAIQASLVWEFVPEEWTGQ